MAVASAADASSSNLRLRLGCAAGRALPHVTGQRGRGCRSPLTFWRTSNTPPAAGQSSAPPTASPGIATPSMAASVAAMNWAKETPLLRIARRLEDRVWWLGDGAGCCYAAGRRRGHAWEGWSGINRCRDQRWFKTLHRHGSTAIRRLTAALTATTVYGQARRQTVAHAFVPRSHGSRTPTNIALGTLGQALSPADRACQAPSMGIRIFMASARPTPVSRATWRWPLSA